MIKLILPYDFDDGCWDSKGYFPKAELRTDGRRFLINFYDPIRLSQDAADESANGKVFFEENIVVVERVTKSALETAAAWLVRTGQLDRLVEAKEK